VKAVAATARVSGSARRAERLWQIFALASIAALGYWWFLSRRQVALGWIGMALMILAAALSVRKRLAYQGVFRMSFWLTAHVYLGVVAAVAILLHTSLRGGSVLTTCLLVLFYLTVGSGVVGWWFARALPPLLTAIEETPAILEDLLATRADCLKGMLELAEGGSPEFKELVRGRLLQAPFHTFPGTARVSAGACRSAGGVESAGAPRLSARGGIRVAGKQDECGAAAPAADARLADVSCREHRNHVRARGGAHRHGAVLLTGLRLQECLN
jgi:hypothetical protein